MSGGEGFFADSNLLLYSVDPVAVEKCDAMSGDAKSACIKQAKARYGM